MRNKNIYSVLFFIAVFVSITMVSCDDDLMENPKDFLSPDNTYVNKDGFDAALTALYSNGRGTIASWQGLYEKEWQVIYGQGADIGFHIDKKNWVSDYSIVHSSNGTVLRLWQKFFSIVKDANVIITRAESDKAEWSSESEKNEVVAQAKFFRAFAYRSLVWYWGDVPILDEEITAPKLDFVRSPKEEVINFIIQDLEFASQNLPVQNVTGAKITKAAADYLLAETYNATQQWDKAIVAADAILNDGQYNLMWTRFGSMTDKTGDVYWDLFRHGNQDRRSGNSENIFSWQFEFDVDGGDLYFAPERAWGPFLERAKTPDNMAAILRDDRLGRPVSFIRITPWVETGMWDDFDNDMRNSEENVQRTFYVNNPASAHFGEAIVPKASDHARFIYPYYKKFTNPHGHPQGYDSQGRVYNDWYVFRVAGVHLLKAEAYLGKGNTTLAAQSINVVRSRAGAADAQPDDITIDYILDERARELLGEENRRVSLARTGKLLERTKLHNSVSGPTMHAHHVLFPIPQVEIDANKEAALQQNPGY